MESLPRLKVTFLPTSTGDSSLNAQAAESRAAALFGHAAVTDPFQAGEKNAFAPWRMPKWVRKPPVPFKLVPSRFLRRARMMPPRDPLPTASGFSQWVYSIYSDARGDEEDMEAGRAFERSFAMERGGGRLRDYASLERVGSDWELLHNGLHATDEHTMTFKTIPDLQVQGQPLRVSPDLMFRHQTTSDVIIVELKYSGLALTTNLWPNVWAQLWCYAQLEVARAAPNVTVIGEVWKRQWHGSRRAGGVPVLCLRASVRRNPRLPAYDRFFRQLFDIYRGADDQAC